MLADHVRQVVRDSSKALYSSVKIEDSEAALYNDFKEESFFDAKEYVYFPKNQGGLFIPHYASKILPSNGRKSIDQIKKAAKSLHAGEGHFAWRKPQVKKLNDSTIMVDWQTVSFSCLPDGKTIQAFFYRMVRVANFNQIKLTDKDTEAKAIKQVIKQKFDEVVGWLHGTKY